MQPTSPRPDYDFPSGDAHVLAQMELVTECLVLMRDTLLRDARSDPKLHGWGPTVRQVLSTPATAADPPLGLRHQPAAWLASVTRSFMSSGHFQTTLMQDLGQPGSWGQTLMACGAGGDEALAWLYKKRTTLTTVQEVQPEAWVGHPQHPVEDSWVEALIARDMPLSLAEHLDRWVLPELPGETIAQWWKQVPSQAIADILATVLPCPPSVACAWEPNPAQAQVVQPGVEALDWTSVWKQWFRPGTFARALAHLTAHQGPAPADSPARLIQAVWKQAPIIHAMHAEDAIPVQALDQALASTLSLPGLDWEPGSRALFAMMLRPAPSDKNQVSTSWFEEQQHQGRWALLDDADHIPALWWSWLDNMESVEEQNKARKVMQARFDRWVGGVPDQVSQGALVTRQGCDAWAPFIDRGPTSQRGVTREEAGRTPEKLWPIDSSKPLPQHEPALRAALLHPEGLDWLVSMFEIAQQHRGVFSPRPQAWIHFAQWVHHELEGLQKWPYRPAAWARWRATMEGWATGKNAWSNTISDDTDLTCATLFAFVEPLHEKHQLEQVIPGAAQAKKVKARL